MSEPAARLDDDHIPATGAAEPPLLSVIEGVFVRMTVELGEARLRLRDILNLAEGSIVDLDAKAGGPLDICVNGQRFGRGELQRSGSGFAIRVTEIHPPQGRAR